MAFATGVSILVEMCDAIEKIQVITRTIIAGIIILFKSNLEIDRCLRIMPPIPTMQYLWQV